MLEEILLDLQKYKPILSSVTYNDGKSSYEFYIQENIKLLIKDVSQYDNTTMDIISKYNGLKKGDSV